MKRTSITFAVAMTAASLFSTTAFADDASRLELATEIAEFVNEHTDFNELVTGVADATLEQFAASGMPAATEDQSEKIRALYLDKLTDPMKEAMQSIGPVYAEIYTEEELAAMFEFYQTPLGTAIVTKNSRLATAIQKPVMDTMQTAMPALMPELMQILQN